MTENKEIKELTTALAQIHQRLQKLTDNLDLEEEQAELRAFLEDGSENAQEEMKRTVRKMQDKLSSLKDLSEEKGRDIDRYVKENPWQVAIAGMMIGALTASLFQRNK